uniref:Uncharacterized protein n=1 Tax=Globodera pallida TaxID=36090 RepID=A0A183C3L9_GLOPA
MPKIYFLFAFFAYCVHASPSLIDSLKGEIMEINAKIQAIRTDIVNWIGNEYGNGVEPKGTVDGKASDQLADLANVEANLLKVLGAQPRAAAPAANKLQILKENLATKIDRAIRLWHKNGGGKEVKGGQTLTQIVEMKVNIELCKLMEEANLDTTIEYEQLVERCAKFETEAQARNANLDWQNVAVYPTGTVSNWRLAMHSYWALINLLKIAFAQNAKSLLIGAKKQEQRHEEGGGGEEDRQSRFEQWLRDNAQLMKSAVDRLFPRIDDGPQNQQKRRRRRKRGAAGEEEEVRCRFDWNAWLQCIGLIVLIIIFILLIILVITVIFGSDSDSNRRHHHHGGDILIFNTGSSRTSSSSYGGGYRSYNRRTSDRPSLDFWNSCSVVWYDSKDLKNLSETSADYETERRANNYFQPNVQEGVFRYIYAKIQQRRFELEATLGECIHFSKVEITASCANCMVLRSLTASNRLSAMNNFGTFLNRWQRTSLFRVDGTVLLTQFRTVRRGGGDRRHSAADHEDRADRGAKEEGTEHQTRKAKDEAEHQTSSSSSKSHHFSDAKQIQREVNAEFLRHMAQSMSKKEFAESSDEQLKSFARDFNKRLPSEFEVEPSTGQQRDYVLRVSLAAVGLVISGLVIGYRILSRERIMPEHRDIVAQQSAVDFDQFVQDYLMAGEVQMVYVYLYPVNCIAVAVLHPGAVIRGQPFNDSGVLIRLDPFMGDMKFMRAFKDVQNRIGVDLRDHVPQKCKQKNKPKPRNIWTHFKKLDKKDKLAKLPKQYKPCKERLNNLLRQLLQAIFKP